ncbi:MAG: ExeA family protein [Terriglobales bacterium]
MYLEFYQLREYPFSLACDPRYLYFSAGHKEAMAGMLYCLRERKGVALLLGEPGTGKTTLLAAVLEMLPGGVVAQALDTPLHTTPAEAMAAILSGFGQASEGLGLSALQAGLRAYLTERHLAGECVLLLIDEAQDLNPLVLEQVRLLTNLEKGGHKLLQIILSGQPELAAHLRTANGRALHQRVAVRCHLAPLNRAETQAYLAARLDQAGSARMLFDDGAAERIHQVSQGIPRVINVVADHCLLAGFAAEAPRLSRGLVDRVVTQLDELVAVSGNSQDGTIATGGMEAAPGTTQTPATLQRFASGWARWAGLAEGSK